MKNNLRCILWFILL